MYSPNKLTSNYITCHMIGRLGNQMFQIANAYAQALRYNRQLVLPRHDTSVSDYYSTMFRRLDFLIDKAPVDNPDVHTIHSTYHYTSYIPHDIKPTVFKGYFESEKFFKDYSQNIKWLYSPPSEFIEKVLKEYPQINQAIITAINVRRGDFLTFPNRHPVLTTEYIHTAVQAAPKSDYYFIVSDDLEWCKNNIKLNNTVFIPYERHEALWLLSMCDHFIISNSTFSWWGAWLSQSSNKIVIAPEIWFGPEILTHTNPKDIWCEEWKKIPSYFKDGMIYPKI